MSFKDSLKTTSKYYVYAKKEDEEFEKFFVLFSWQLLT